MSLLNLALQNCALKRTKTVDKFEAKMKNSKGINHLRNSADRREGLKAAFTESMNPVITLVNSRFETMKIKDEPVQSMNAVSDEDIEQLKDSIYLIDITIDFKKLTEAELKEKNDFSSFIMTNCKSTCYRFQTKKCHNLDCVICSRLQPIRLPTEVFDNLAFYQTHY